MQEISYEGGVKSYRVNERLYFRHDLLKIQDVRAPSGQSRIPTEDEQPLVPPMQQQYSRNVNRRLRLGRLYGDDVGGPLGGDTPSISVVLAGLGGTCPGS